MVKKLWKTKTSNLGTTPQRRTRSLIEQSQRGGLKNVDASTAGIIPGDRGKAGGSWCRLPLQTAQVVCQAYITSSSGRSRVRSVFTNQELSGKARLETAREPSQAHGAFRPVRRRSYPRGFRLLLRRPERSRIVRRANPAKRPCSFARVGRVRTARRRGANGPGKVRKPPHWGGVKKHVTPLQKRKQPES
jgi:hypothetical protein